MVDYSSTKETKSSSANNEDNRDPVTRLGGQAFIILALILLKLFAQCFGVDSSNDGEISNSSIFRLHEAFQYPF
jgi:hypothetical protein